MLTTHTTPTNHSGELDLPEIVKGSGGRHRTGEPIRDLFERLGEENRIAVQRAADQAAAEAQTVEFAGIAELFKALDGMPVKITRDPNFVAQDCEWCDVEPPRRTSVRIYGEPSENDPHNYKPLEMEETCAVCAPAAIRQARIEQDPNSDRDIKVELAARPVVLA